MPVTSDSLCGVTKLEVRFGPDRTVRWILVGAR